MSTGCCPPTRCPALTEPSDHKAKGSFAEAQQEDFFLRYYRVGNEASRKAVVLIEDIFGVDSGRHVGVCDELAEKLDCVVIAPDFFRGNPGTHEMLGNGKLMEFISKLSPDDIKKDLDYIYNTVVPKDSFDVLGLVGFCWGSYIVFEEGCRMPDARLRGGANFHPSLRLAGVFGGSVEKLGQENKIAMLVCPCKDDPENIKPGEACVLPPTLNQIHVFEEMNHGFVTQGDVKDEAVARNVAKAMDMAVEFFGKAFAHETPSCCPPTRCPALTDPSDHKAKGSFLEVQEGDFRLRYYKVGNEASRKAVVLIEDIFGVDSGRHVGVCDELADKLDCVVVAPDFFRGNPATFDMIGDGTLMKFIAQLSPGELKKDLDYIYNTVVPNDSFDFLGLVGFCWGSYIVFEEGCRMPDARLRGGANFHPSLRLAGMFGGSVEKLGQENQLSMLVCPCSDDPEDIKPGEACVLPATLNQIHVFEEMNHGFVTQGNVKDETVAKNVAKAIDLAVEFFKQKFQ